MKSIRMDLGYEVKIDEIILNSLNKHKDLSERFDCHIIDEDIYYKYKLYSGKAYNDFIKLLETSDRDYSYIALYHDKHTKITHGTTNTALENIIKENKLIASSNFNYGIWFTQVGTGYFWESDKYITLNYTKPILKVIESTENVLEPAMGCVIACESIINLEEYTYTISDTFDTNIDLDVALHGYGLPKSLVEIKKILIEGLLNT